jgi:hypothetical protein
MLDLAQAVREQIVKETPPRKGETPRSFTLEGLRRLALWGGTATGALFLAVISSRSEVGAARLAVVFHDDRPQSVRVFDAEAETRRLNDAVRGLAADSDQIKTRLASVEQGMDDVTGSISKEIETANATQRFNDGPSVAATAASSTSMMGALPAQPSAATARSGAVTSSADAAASASPQTAYGVDIGSGQTIQALRARWEVLRSAHPQLFEGLRPIVTVKEVLHGNRVELRLVAGPLVQPGAATQLCASLTPFGLFCQPTVFDGQHLAWR